MTYVTQENKKHGATVFFVLCVGEMNPAPTSLLLRFSLHLLLLQQVGVWGVQRVLNSPLFHEPTNPLLVPFVSDRGARLRPAEQGFKVDLVTSLHHHVTNVFVRDSATDGACADAEHLGRFRDGEANDRIQWRFLHRSNC